MISIFTSLNNDKGIATFETVPLLFIFIIFIGYGLGAFGIVHTGILHSISARTYALETFRHRTHLVYFRENREAGSKHFAKKEIRLHGIKSENDTDKQYIFATERPISFGFGSNQVVGRNTASHERIQERVESGTRTQANTAVSPAWIKVQYGICINASCGGS